MNGTGAEQGSGVRARRGQILGARRRSWARLGLVCLVLGLPLALAACGGEEDEPQTTAAAPAEGATGATGEVGATEETGVVEGTEEGGAQTEIEPFIPEAEAEAAYEVAFEYVVALKEGDTDAACELEDKSAAKNADPDGFWCDNYDGALEAVEGQLEPVPEDVGPGYVEFNNLDTGQSIQLNIGQPNPIKPDLAIFEARAIDG